MKAPERIDLHYKGGQASFAAWGAFDTTKPFRETYVRADIADRSQESHSHHFAELNELYQNLPEHLTSEIWAANAETFRKFCLIRTKQFHAFSSFFLSEKDARALTPDQKKALNGMHGYIEAAGVDTDHGFVVTYRIPHSQSYHSMGKKAFQESKEKCLEFARELVGLNNA